MQTRARRKEAFAFVSRLQGTYQYTFPYDELGFDVLLQAANHQQWDDFFSFIKHKENGETGWRIDRALLKNHPYDTQAFSSLNPPYVITIQPANKDGIINDTVTVMNAKTGSKQQQSLNACLGQGSFGCVFRVGNHHKPQYVVKTPIEGWTKHKEFRYLRQDSIREYHMLCKAYPDAGPYAWQELRRFDAETQAIEYTYRLTMPFIDGTSWESFVENYKGPLNRLAKIILEIAKELYALHRKDVIHGDLMSQNIMILRGGKRVKIIDFGYAYKKGKHASVFPSNNDRFYAPETIKKHVASEYNDIWTLARSLECELKNLTEQFGEETVDYFFTTFPSIRSFIEKGMSAIPKERPTLPNFIEDLTREIKAHKANSKPLTKLGLAQHGLFADTGRAKRTSFEIHRDSAWQRAVL